MTKSKNFSINWVLIDELAIGSAPQTDNDITLLKTSGIKNIITLCKLNEMELFLELGKNFNFRHFPLPDHKDKVPPSLTDLNNILNYMKECKNLGPTFVHCFAGVERSPLVCIAWLMRESSLSLEDALQYLMKINPGTCPLGYQLKILQDI